MGGWEIVVSINTYATGMAVSSAVNRRRNLKYRGRMLTFAAGDAYLYIFGSIFMWFTIARHALLPSDPETCGQMQAKVPTNSSCK